MIKLWLLIWYFTQPDRPHGKSALLWYTDEISRSDFRGFLVGKNFREDWRLTLRRWYHRICPPKQWRTTEFGLRLAKRQFEEIDDLIDFALARKLLKARTTSARPTASDTFLTIDWEGRAFLRPLPFLEANVAEYPALMTPLVSGLIALIISLTVAFWDDLSMLASNVF